LLILGMAPSDPNFDIRGPEWLIGFIVVGLLVIAAIFWPSQKPPVSPDEDKPREVKAGFLGYLNWESLEPTWNVLVHKKRGRYIQVSVSMGKDVFIRILDPTLSGPLLLSVYSYQQEPAYDFAGVRSYLQDTWYIDHDSAVAIVNRVADTVDGLSEMVDEAVNSLGVKKT